jgi:hypothetical protein
MYLEFTSMLEFYRNKVNELSAQDIHSSADGVPAKAVEVCLLKKKNILVVVIYVL